MFEEDPLDEEIKKKKQRVLVGLFFLFLVLLGTTAVLPLGESSPLAGMPVSEAGEVPLAHTPTLTRPTLVPPGTATNTPMLTVTSPATTASPPEATPQPTETATATAPQVTPTLTEEAAGGFGGGALVTPTISSMATGTSAAPQPAETAMATASQVTPTLTEEAAGGLGGGTLLPEATPTLLTTIQLPASGTDGSWRLGWPIFGLVAVLLGTLMLRVGYAAWRAGEG